MRFVKDRPGHDWRYAIDAAKIQAELGWHPTETIATGMRKTVAWYVAKYTQQRQTEHGRSQMDHKGIPGMGKDGR